MTMKTKRDRDTLDSRAGSTLVIVMFVAGMMVMAATFMMFVAGNASHRARRLNQDAQAQAIAEAGVADTVAAMKTNYAHWVNATNERVMTIGGREGAYKAVTSLQSNGVIVVSSQGSMDGAEIVTVVELLGTESEENNSLWGPDSAVLAEDDVTISTGAPRIYGDVHSNADVEKANPAQPNVYGDITAVGTVAVTPQSPGTATSGAAPRGIPEFNFESYRQLAISGGLYYEGDQVFPGRVVKPANGILYVNGDVRFARNSGIEGTIVANGNITIDNRFVQTQVIPNMPAMLATGHIDLNNRNNYEGVIYGKLSVDSWNRKLLYGGIVSHGWINIRNRMELFRQSGYPIWDPANTNDPDVVVGGWVQ